VLRLLLEIVETNAPYQELSRPLAKKQDITLCSYFRSAVEVPDDLRLFEGGGTVLGFFRALRSALRSEEYDVIHAETPHVAFLFLLGYVLNRRLMASTVFTVSNSYSSWKPRNKLLLLPAFAFFHRVVCCGGACFASFPVLYRRLAGRRYRSVPNGVDIDRIDAAIAEDPPRGDGTRFTVTSVSRLVPIKNHATVLRAFELCRRDGDRLVYVGEGSERQLLVSEIAARDLEEDVELLGLLRREQVYQQMASADVYVSASHGEGLPIAVLEAMVARRPVILSDIPPHREIAEGAGFIPLLDPDSVDGFAAEIARIRALSPARRAEIGDRCRAHVERRFALANMHAGYEEIYRELVAERRRRRGRPSVRHEARTRA
jgi:glycosyltransferase involved in cell wall biosynthesis